MQMRLAVDGMHCAACTGRVESALRAVEGVRSARVSLTPPLAQLELDREIPLERLAHAAEQAGGYTLAPAPDAAGAPAPAQDPGPIAQLERARPSLFPLALIVAFLCGLCALTTFARGDASWRSFMLDVMGGFFVVFSFFKLLDLRGFANAYQMYDLIAARSRAYALAYPFIELMLGVAYLVRWNLPLTNALTLAVMLVSSLGVLSALRQKRGIRCACLGSTLNLPMTTVTLVEDLGMAAMAAAGLIWAH